MPGCARPRPSLACRSPGGSSFDRRSDVHPLAGTTSRLCRLSCAVTRCSSNLKTDLLGLDVLWTPRAGSPNSRTPGPCKQTGTGVPALCNIGAASGSSCCDGPLRSTLSRYGGQETVYAYRNLGGVSPSCKGRLFQHNQQLRRWFTRNTRWWASRTRGSPHAFVIALNTEPTGQDCRQPMPPARRVVGTRFRPPYGGDKLDQLTHESCTACGY